MKTQRYNSFDMIHKALRALLYDTALTLQQTDFDNENETEIGLKKIEETLSVFASHAKHEDEYILPAVIKYDRETVMMIEAEHDKDEALTNQLENSIEAYRFAASAAARIKTGRQIFYLFIEFVGFNLIHMNKEEHLINEILWRNYSDEQLLILNNKLRSSVTEEEMAFILPWIIKGISNLELLQFLTGMKLNSQPQMFEYVMQVAEKNVAAKRWMDVMEKMDLEATQTIIEF